jgi:hypothetical protein
MAFTHGKNTYLAFGTINLSPYLNSVDRSRGAATAETTVFGVPATQFVNGIVNTTFTCTGLFDQAVVSSVIAAVGGTAQTIVYGPAGSATGSPKESVQGLLIDYGITGAVADAVAMSLNWQASGTVTDSVF